MPELSEDMYCSQQICIPPTFPYLLRQYAKAAIRTQPTDLLRWSTAYFRCLSLGLPPPIKPRLEYPIPKDYHGLTPGWLKALLYQLQKNLTVDFRVLWERWQGACLDHGHLIQILCLGQFDDNTAVPWLRFIALCAGFLSDTLTQTMILICEILTEEPEGGSAMITLDVFLDLYKFLAKIDASKGQWIPNIHFTDSFLNLLKKKYEEEMRKAQEQELEEEESAASEKLEEEKKVAAKERDLGEVISCPSIGDEDYTKIEDYLRKLHAEGGEGDEEEKPAALTEGKIDEEEEKESHESELSKDEEDEDEKASEDEIATHELEEGKEEGEEGKKGSDVDVTEQAKDEPSGLDLGDGEAEKAASVASVHSVKETEADREKKTIELMEEDLTKLKALQQEIYGETDEEVEKLKKTIIGEVHITKSDEEKLTHYETKIIMSSDDLDSAVDELDEGESGKGSEKDEKPCEMIYVEPVPGIGGVVPDEIINTVCKYMKDMAKEQHGMVMPRNIRHYNCPPLEPFSSVGF